MKKQEGQLGNSGEYTGQVNPDFDDAVLVVSDDEFRDIQEQIGDEQETFEAIEHKAIGDRAFKELYRKSREAKDMKLLQFLAVLQENNLIDAERWVVSNGLKLSSGDIVALGGDFYGLPKEPICHGDNPYQQKDRFFRAYTSLCVSVEKQEQVAEILKLVENEEKVILLGIREANKEDRKQPDDQLHSISTKQNKAYAKLTQYVCLPGTFMHSRYLNLATMNFDHFNDDAKVAYEAGHEVALDTARQAKNEENDVERRKLFVTAITQELFACHYLTDLFASGHLRTERKRLYDHVMENGWTPGKAYIAGALAKAMHDEDNHHGLLVQNGKEAEWKAFGDACHFKKANTDNRDHVCETVVLALKSIFDTFFGREVQYNFRDYVPRVRPENPTSPLFKFEDNKLKIRRNLDDVSSIDYDEMVSPVKILCRLRKKIFANAHDEDAVEMTNEDVDLIEQELERLVKEEEITLDILGEGSLTCTVL